MIGFVQVLLGVMVLVLGIVIGALATRSGYRHHPPAPPKPPGRHSLRPGGQPERRRDYGAAPMPPLRKTWDREEPKGPVREAVRPLGGSPAALGRPWHEGMGQQPETREMRAPRPSPGQDMERWRREQERDA